MSARRGAVVLLLTLQALMQAAWPAAAEPVTTILNNGPSANRVDIVVLGDGFTAAEISAGAYRSAVQTFLAGMFGQDPYREYMRAFNVHLVDVTSNQSGADHPERGSFVDTALDSTYFCNSIQRLICSSTTKVNAVIARSALAANARDIVLVIVNDTEYGGSGGAIAVVSRDAQAVELILHEVGHSFGQLADEYVDQPPTCSDAQEPPEVNATRAAGGAVKWAHWIAGAPVIPTPGTALGVPGAYQGSRYCPATLYRPTYNSKMRSLGRPFDQINTEQHVRRIYNLVSPIDGVSPPLSTTAINQGDRFAVTVVQPATHNLDVTWRVDGAVIATGLEFHTSAVPQGLHQITATVRDTTTMVRSDPSGLLTETVSWSVTVGPALPNANPTGLRATSIVGNQVTIAWTAPTATTPTGYVLEGGAAPGQVLASVPTGSTAPTFTFIAPTGTFYIRVHALVGGSRSAPSNEILIAVNVPTPPAAPDGLLGTANGSALALAWRNTTGGGTPTGVRLDVTGSLTAALPLPLSETFSFAGVPAGTYTFAVRSTNAAGVSGPSLPVTLTFPGTCSAPLAPTALTVSTSGSIVNATWQLPASGNAPTSYLLIVTGAFNGVFPLPTRTIAAPAPPGSYTLSVVAVGACGQSAPTAAQTVTVP